MRFRLVAIVALVSVAASFAMANEQAATLEFNWNGVRPCNTLSASPAFVVRNYPPAAKRVRLIFSQGSAERGGGEIDMPPGGNIPAGAVHTWAPCNADMYIWKAIFKSSTGEVLGEASGRRVYPDAKASP